MLLRCSKKKDMSEWNQWRENNSGEEVLLEGAAPGEAHLEGADLTGAHLEDAHLVGTHLEGALLERAHLEGAHIELAHLEGAYLFRAHLEGANLLGTHLEGAYLMGTHLEGAECETAAVDGSTLLWKCEIDRETNFASVALDSARIDPGTKQLLEYNIRRINWERWYKDNRLRQWPMRMFWWMSDYGRSTGRILFTFFFLAFVFAAIYYICGRVSPPGIVCNLFADAQGPVPGWLVPVRAMYFSIVTMTTLGFGDMYAATRSLAGHLLLTFQVLLGYCLLAALVTRLAILFTASGPAGKFAKNGTRGEQ